jgi:hypothetical protein
MTHLDRAVMGKMLQTHPHGGPDAMGSVSGPAGN